MVHCLKLSKMLLYFSEKMLCCVFQPAFRCCTSKCWLKLVRNAKYEICLFDPALVAKWSKTLIIALKWKKIFRFQV